MENSSQIGIKQEEVEKVSRKSHQERGNLGYATNASNSGIHNSLSQFQLASSPTNLYGTKPSQPEQQFKRTFIPNQNVGENSQLSGGFSL